jgi:hypothetical protein
VEISVPGLHGEKEHTFFARLSFTRLPIFKRSPVKLPFLTHVSNFARLMTCKK